MVLILFAINIYMPPLKPCKPGTHRNPKTNRCIKTQKNKKMKPIVSLLQSQQQQQRPRYKMENPSEMKILTAFANNLFDNQMRNNLNSASVKKLSKMYSVDGSKISGIDLCKKWITESITPDVMPDAIYKYNRYFAIYTTAYTAAHAAEHGVHIDPGDVSIYTIYLSKPELTKLQIFDAHLKYLKTAAPTLDNANKELAKLFGVFIDILLSPIEHFDDAELCMDLPPEECARLNNMLICLTGSYLFNATRMVFGEDDYRKKEIADQLLGFLRGISFRSTCKKPFEIVPENIPIVYYLAAHL